MAEESRFFLWLWTPSLFFGILFYLLFVSLFGGEFGFGPGWFLLLVGLAVGTVGGIGRRRLFNSYLLASTVKAINVKNDKICKIIF